MKTTNTYLIIILFAFSSLSCSKEEIKEEQESKIFEQGVSKSDYTKKLQYYWVIS